MRTFGLLAVTSVLVWSVLAQPEDPDVEWGTNHLRIPIEPAEEGAEPDPSFVQPFSGAEDIGEHIINGEVATYGDHPYICSLQLLFNGYWYFICGSVIYNENTIMTAAHCVDGNRATDLRVRCGDFHLIEPDLYEQTKAITEITMHQRWANDASQGFRYDIAVMKVETPLVFNNYVNTLPIAAGGTHLPLNCQLAGWGKTEEGTISYELREVTIQQLRKKECQTTWGGLIKKGHLCFMDEGESDSSCNGDSGGPAVCGNYLVGVTSWGVKDCVQGYPSVYTRLARYKGWVEKKAF